MTTLPRRPLRTLTMAATAAALTSIALAGPASADAFAPAPVPAPVPSDVDVFEQQVVDRTNAARAAAGCGPVLVDPALNVAADRHSAEMAWTGTMSHTGVDGSTPRTRLSAQGWNPHRTAENVAFGYDAASVVDAWLGSPGHRANVLDCRLNFLGVAASQGATGTYWTQVFAS